MMFIWKKGVSYMGVIKAFDEDIKKSMHAKAEEAAISENMFQRIRIAINNQTEGEEMMKNRFKIKSAKRWALGLSIGLLSITCMAAAPTIIKSWVSYGTTAYTELPTKEQVKKDVGYEPKYAKVLPGGFLFKEASVVNKLAIDEQDNKLPRGKGITFYYEQQNGQGDGYLSLSTDKMSEGLEEALINGESINYRDVTLKYDKQTYKFVPEDYELTEQDKIDMEIGKIEISVGTDEVMFTDNQFITWEQDNILYMLLTTRNISKDQLLEMAKVIIDTP